MGKVKAMAMDMEEQFIERVSETIGGQETVEELMLDLVNNGATDLIRHMDWKERAEFITELWNEYWSNYTC